MDKRKRKFENSQVKNICVPRLALGGQTDFRVEPSCTRNLQYILSRGPMSSKVNICKDNLGRLALVLRPFLTPYLPCMRRNKCIETLISIMRQALLNLRFCPV